MFRTMDAPNDQKNRDRFASVGAFVNSLPELRKNGCALLVVGDVPQDVHAHASRQMLGLNQREKRHRLLVLTDGDYTGASRRLSKTSADFANTTSIIAHKPQSRSATTGPHPSLEPISKRELYRADLGDLCLAIHEEIEVVEERMSELNPAGLRVCLSSLLPLLGEHDSETIFRFLHLMSWRAKFSRGIIHVHLPVQRDCSNVRLFEPLFDAVIELRIQGSEIQQRWRLTDGEGMSRWMVM